jgi:hypothetical protein
MTAPAPTADGARLVAVAAWDAAGLRGAVILLAAVAARLPFWRLRLATVARSLQEGEVWSGPAAQHAAAAALQLSTVAAAVDGALSESLSGFERVATEAAAAQELAAAALRAGSSTGLAGALDAHARRADLLGRLAPGAQDPRPDPGAALALAALEHATAASTAAAAAAEPVTGFGGLDAWAAVSFGELAAATGFVGPVLPAPFPLLRGLAEVTAWWAALSLAAQLAVVRAHPAAVGALDGVPAWARDRANRLVLARALGDPATPPRAAFVAGVVSRRIAAEEDRGQQVQLHLLDLQGDHVVLALGDLDTADAVAVLVPGVGNSPGDDLGDLSRTATDVAAATRAAAPGLAVATAVWLGYRPPGVPGMALRTAATTGGAALAAGLAGLSAARAATGSPPPRTTVLAHSYGTVVVDEAADAPGRLAADAVVLLGSPGMEDDARALEVPEVFDADAPADPVAALGYFGTGTGADSFGSTALPVQLSMGHSDYYDSSRPTLGAIGEVVAGVRTTEERLDTGPGTGRPVRRSMQ